jgi:hypothetical protein
MGMPYEASLGDAHCTDSLQQTKVLIVYEQIETK